MSPRCAATGVGASNAYVAIPPPAYTALVAVLCFRPFAVAVIRSAFRMLTRKRTSRCDHSAGRIAVASDPPWFPLTIAARGVAVPDGRFARRMPLLASMGVRLARLKEVLGQIGAQPRRENLLRLWAEIDDATAAAVPRLVPLGSVGPHLKMWRNRFAAWLMLVRLNRSSISV